MRAPWSVLGVCIFSGSCCGVALLVAVTVTISSMYMSLCLQVPTNPIAHQVFCVCVCVSESECVRLSVYHSGNRGPPASALILIKVFCVKRSE